MAPPPARGGYPLGRKPSVGRSVRIDADVDEQLRDLAAARGVSVNTLTAKALSRYIEWDSFGEKFGLTDMPATIVQKILGALSEADLADMGRWTGTTLLREMILFWFKEITPQTVLEAFPRLVSRYGRLFEYVEREEGGQHTLVIKHQGGPKLSSLYSEVIRAAFEELLASRVSIESTENQVVARFSTFPGAKPPAPRTTPRTPGPPAGQVAPGGAAL